ncbi:hypothetical protein BH20ACT5_BH20ACT5_18310 [soil metagenome]
MAFESGRRASHAFQVGEHDTATALGSGDVPVLGTPRLLAWAEAVSVAALAGQLPVGATSVGSYVVVEHLAASPVGVNVTVTATVTGGSGRSVEIGWEAVQDGATVVGRGTVRRTIVDRERFLGRASGYPGSA